MFNILLYYTTTTIFFCCLLATKETKTEKMVRVNNSERIFAPNCPYTRWNVWKSLTLSHKCVLCMLSLMISTSNNQKQKEYHLCVSVTSQQGGNNTSPKGKMNQKLYILLLHHIDTSFSDVLWRKIVTIHTATTSDFSYDHHPVCVCIASLSWNTQQTHTETQFSSLQFRFLMLFVFHELIYREHHIRHTWDEVSLFYGTDK